MCANKEIFSPSEESVKSIIEKIQTVELCDNCLGRQVGKIGHGYTNRERGMMIRGELKFPGLGDDKKCWLCQDLFDGLDDLASAAIAELSSVEYETFALGSRMNPALIDREEQIWSECGADYAEPIKGEINREVGKIVERLTKKNVDINSPDVKAIIDVDFLEVELEISSLFFYGRYRKYDRTIPQTKWPCRKCMGKGCERCGNTGKIYPESVEELIGSEFLKATSAERTSFHGMGREDIDARMLGNGRPFVLELKRPKVRNIGLEEIVKVVNRSNEGRVEVFGMRPSSKDEVRRIKESTAQKSYRIVIQLAGISDSTKLKEVIRLLTQSPIEQRTPKRVAHRRADKVRNQRITQAELEKLEGDIATIRIRAVAGTYIKELMHGDDGRTHPSLAELLETRVEIKQLDVIEIHDECECDGAGI